MKTELIDKIHNMTMDERLEAAQMMYALAARLKFILVRYGETADESLSCE